MRLESMRPEYVDFIPKELEDGVLYISKTFRTASHRCCCGCGTKIVTPLRETEYQLTEREGRISLDPSIGNWNHTCRSHYFIKNNRVVWSRTMNREEIRLGRAHDDALRESHFAKIAWPWRRRAGSHIKRWFNNYFG